MTDREKFETICNLTTNLVGLRQGSLAKKTRKETIHIPRMVAALIGRLTKDIHPTIIADVLERDRTSVLHYEKSHKHNYASFPLYRNMFNKVYNAYVEMEKFKLIFESRDELGRYLIRSGVKIVAKPQVRIKVKSGNARYIVPTNYLDFSNNINIIRESLKDYDYSIDIITI